MTNPQETRTTPVTREVLSERVKDRILTWILKGELAPGSRIVETRVARDLGVSQAPVREALRDLATLGFVEMRPHKGARVRKPTKQELTEAIEVRAELEALAGRLAAERRTEQCLTDLDDLYVAMEEAADRGDPHDQAINNTRFHARIIEAAGNATLARLWSMLEPFSRTYFTASVPGIDLHWLSHRHDEMLEAIRDQDPGRAEETMRTHAAEAAELLSGIDLIAEESGDG
ncbi:GntR family transcriptional regulator [bacterium]|nr:GntR family transcriptional regulator [bacterium]